MTDTASTEATIAALEDDRQRAMLAGDVDRLRELYADDLVYVHTTGDHDTKESYLGKVAEAFVRYRYIERIDEKVIVHGEVAYLTGQQIGLSILQGQPRLMNCSYLAIWKVVEGEWQFAAWHATAPGPIAGR